MGPKRTAAGIRKAKLIVNAAMRIAIKKEVSPFLLSPFMLCTKIYKKTTKTTKIKHIVTYIGILHTFFHDYTSLTITFHTTFLLI